MNRLEQLAFSYGELTESITDGGGRVGRLDEHRGVFGFAVTARLDVGILQRLEPNATPAAQGSLSTCQSNSDSSSDAENPRVERSDLEGRVAFEGLPRLDANLLKAVLVVDEVSSHPAACERRVHRA